MDRKRFVQARKKLGITQTDLAERMDVSQGAVSAWERGERDPGSDMVAKMAEVLGVSADWLLGASEDMGQPRANRVPVLGRIPAGIPIDAIEDIIDWEDIPASWLAGGREYFALKVHGDSMYPEYRSGDVLILRKTETCETGDDCAVMVNGDEATFKRIRLTDSGMILQPLNPAYDPIAFTAEQVAALPVRILGVVEEMRRSKHRR